MQARRETENEIVISVSKPSLLSADQVRDFLKSGKKVRIEWDRQPADLKLFSEFSDKYFIQVGMSAPSIKRDLKLETIPTNSLNDELTKKVVMDSYQSGFAQIWKDQISESVVETLRDAVRKIATSKTTKFVEIDAKTAGLIIIDNYAIYTGENKDHIAWVWIDPNLSKDKRRIVGASLLAAAQAVAPKEVVAGIYIRNLRSYGFLRKAGFETIGASFVRSR